MKKLVFGLCLGAGYSTASWAGFTNPIESASLDCVGNSKDRQIQFIISSNLETTRFGGNLSLDSAQSLTLANAGGRGYIEQVSTEANYHLFLTGDSLTNFESGEKKENIELAGSLTMGVSTNYDLECRGTLRLK